VVKAALSTACQSGRSLSWKVQENSKGLHIQLVWKAEPDSYPTGGNTIRVGSNWKNRPEVLSCGKATESDAGSNRKSGMDPSAIAGRSSIVLATCRKRRGSVRLELAEMPGGYKPFWIENKHWNTMLPRKCLILLLRRLVEFVMMSLILTGMI
jgi:hypothetical protein